MDKSKRLEIFEKVRQQYGNLIAETVSAEKLAELESKLPK
jgi:hypothetical protein